MKIISMKWENDGDASKGQKQGEVKQRQQKGVLNTAGCSKHYLQKAVVVGI